MNFDDAMMTIGERNLAPRLFAPLGDAVPRLSNGPLPEVRAGTGTPPRTRASVASAAMTTVAIDRRAGMVAQAPAKPGREPASVRALIVSATG